MYIPLDCRFPEMPDPSNSTKLVPVQGPQRSGQAAINARADAWRLIANERLAYRRRVNGHSKADH